MDKRAFTIIIALIVAAYFFGRWSAPEKVKIEKQVVKVEVEKKSVEKSGEQVRVVTEIVRPDGTRLTRTRSETSHKSLSISEKSQSTVLSETKTITNRTGVVVSVLLGASLKNLAIPTVGFSLDKQILGPVHVGAFLFPSETKLGLSFGVGF